MAAEQCEKCSAWFDTFAYRRHRQAGCVRLSEPPWVKRLVKYDEKRDEKIIALKVQQAK